LCVPLLHWPLVSMSSFFLGSMSVFKRVSHARCFPGAHQFFEIFSSSGKGAFGGVWVVLGSLFLDPPFFLQNSSREIPPASSLVRRCGPPTPFSCCFPFSLPVWQAAFFSPRALFYEPASDSSFFFPLTTFYSVGFRPSWMRRVFPSFLSFLRLLFVSGGRGFFFPTEVSPPFLWILSPFSSAGLISSNNLN